jgi:hypothetical protein
VRHGAGNLAAAAGETTTALESQPAHLTPSAAATDCDTEKRFYLVTKQCHFEPYVTAVQTDNSLSIKNSDPVLHVLKFSREDQVLFTLPLQANESIVKKIDQKGLIEIKCVIHPYMKSYIAVLDTPIYVLSDSNGSFHFQNLESGKYSISIWHKSFGSIEKEIEIVPGKRLNLPFELQQK